MKIRKLYAIPVIIGLLLITSMNIYTYFDSKRAESAAQAELDEYNKMNAKLPPLNMEAKESVMRVKEH